MSVRVRWAHAAAAWAGLFAGLHVFWALGGSLGLASSAGADLAARRPTWFVVGGLWGVAVILVLAAVIARALGRASVRRPLVVLGGAIGLLLLLRGLAIEVLLLAGAYDSGSAISGDQRYVSLVLWNPWFVIGGIAFLVAARAARPERSGGRSVKVRPRSARGRG